MKILLIEPNALLAAQYGEYLDGLGHSVRAVHRAQDAIMAADNERPDLVILEPLLSGHSGIEFLYEFRSYPEWQKVPVIVLSRVEAEGLGLTAQACKELAVTVLYKPDTTLEKLGDEADKV